MCDEMVYIFLSNPFKMDIKIMSVIIKIQSAIYEVKMGNYHVLYIPFDVSIKWKGSMRWD